MGRTKEKWGKKDGAAGSIQRGKNHALAMVYQYGNITHWSMAELLHVAEAQSRCSSLFVHTLPGLLSCFNLRRSCPSPVPQLLHAAEEPDM